MNIRRYAAQALVNVLTVSAVGIYSAALFIATLTVIYDDMKHLVVVCRVPSSGILPRDSNANLSTLC